MNENRQSRLRLVLGDDQIAFERIEGVEGLSTPFTYLVDVRSDLEVDLYPYIGAPASVEILEDDSSQRFFHGLIVATEHQSESQSGEQYRLTLRPWTYFLAQNRDMAIFQEKDAVEIIKDIFTKNGVSDVEWRVSGEFQKRVYCVQYRESDFAFISRLMEEEGIYYFFRHERDRHVMVIGNAPQSHVVGKPESLVYRPTSVSVFSVDSAQRAGSGQHRLQSWKERISSGGENRVTLADFDFTSLKMPLTATHSDEAGHPRGAAEVYDYPGRYQRDEATKGNEEAVGRVRSKARLDELRAERRVFTGTSQSGGLSVGSFVSIAEHPASRMNGRYLITSTLHAIASETHRSGGKDGEQAFNVRFEAIPADTIYHPPRVTPKPVVQGLESAVVTGPAGETIHTDKYGRVKVQFHWDRHGRMDDLSSCWIRVSQTGLLGNQILPRVGHEVLIDFLHGDPDRPVIVGRVYNASNMPQYELPRHKTRALWRTLTYGETAEDLGNAITLDTKNPRANEIRLEDLAGQEEFFLHAQRQMTIRVRYNETHHVGNDQFTLVGWNREAEIRHDDTTTVKNNRTETVEKNETVEIKEMQSLTVGRDRDTHVKGKETRQVDMSYLLRANTSIELICGSSSIKIDPTGITLKALSILVDAGVQAEMKGVVTTVQASGILTLKGGITFIN